jgi:hypothetical protein
MSGIPVFSYFSKNKIKSSKTILYEFIGRRKQFMSSLKVLLFPL